MTDKLENYPPVQPPVSGRAIPPPVDVLPDHIFTRMKNMLAGSLNKLPTPLVLILMASLLAVVLTGLSVKFMAGKPQDPFLAQRLSADSSAPSLDMARMMGLWTANINGYTMTLRLQDNAFEWVVRPPNNEFERVFVRGNFKTVGNVLILGPREDMGKPETTLEQGVVFLPMGLSGLNMKAEENGRLMVWILPQSERRRQGTNIRNLFPSDAGKPLTWVRM